MYDFLVFYFYFIFHLLIYYFQIEILANDLSHAIVWQQFEHHTTAHKYLDMSQHVRQNILELASIANMTASQIKLRMLLFNISIL